MRNKIVALKHKTNRIISVKIPVGADVGGRGASMIVSEKPDISTWTVEKPDGTKITIQVNKKDANKY